MKQKLINWFMILEPIVNFVLSFWLLQYCQFYIKTFNNSILLFSVGDIYIRVVKYTALIILLIALIRTIFKNKVLKFRYFVYAFVCIIQLSTFRFFQSVCSGNAYDTSIGVISVNINAFSDNLSIESYYFYDNYDLESICTREKEIINYIPEDKIIDNNGIIEYYYYDGKYSIKYSYEFENELTYEEKLEYVNVFVNEVYSYDEKNLLE